MRSSASLLLRLSPAIDALLTAIAFGAFWDGGQPNDRALAFLNLLVIPSLLGTLRFVGVYESQRMESRIGLVRKVVTANAIVFTLEAIGYLMAAGPVSLPSLARAAAAITLLIIGEKLAVYSALRILRRRGHDLRRVCVVGAWDWAQDIAASFENESEWGLRLSCVGLGPGAERNYVRYPGGERAGTDLSDVLSTEVIDEVLIAVRPEELPREATTLQVCEQFGVMGRVMLDTRERRELSRLESFAGEVTFAVGIGPRDEWHLTLKRLIDIVGGVVLAIAFAPVLAAAAVLVKLSSSGPILFTQPRVGLHGRRFTMLKFRTMIDGAEALLPAISARSITKGPIFKDPRDFRITPIGRILRKFSIDELPQLFNVIKGDMSLVGPRPLPVHESAAITGPYRRRFCMRPGITCLWQINGRSNVDYTTWMNYDLQYVDRWSLSMDARLLLKTIPAVLSRRGAY
jgi:exopolysaccharide biosynthesis polyprenyl glycosylphosphotransferase